MWELPIWPKEVILVSRTQPSGPLCLWQCCWIYVSVHYHQLKARHLVIQLLAVLQEISNPIFLNRLQIYNRKMKSCLLTIEHYTIYIVSIKCSNEIFLSISLVYHPLQAIAGSRKHLDNDEKVKLWTCLATPGLPSEVKSGPALSVSLKSVSSVSLTVPPGCRQEDGFLEKGRLLPREVREWRKGKPSLFTSSSSSIMNHSLPPP